MARKRLKSGIPALLAVALAIPGTAAHADGALAPLRALARSGAKVSALVVRLDDGRTIASLGPDLGLTPASVSKLYVAAATLETMAPEYRFDTRLLATGPVKDGVLEGNLVFAGSGDPAFTDLQLWQLARNLGEHGIRHVTGSLVVNGSLFGAVACAARDRCRAADASSHAYDAPLSAAAVDFSTVGVAVIPARSAGTDATLAVEPYPVPMFELAGHVRTVATGGAWRVSLARTTRGGRDVLRVSGSAPAGAAPRRYYRAVSDPDRFAGETLRAFLARAGITIAGAVKIDDTSPPQGTEVARVQGQPLWIEVRRMLTWSNNFMADTLALDLLRRDQHAPLSVTSAGAALTREARALETESNVMRGHHPQVNLLSGSGLTPASRASARDVVALLDTLYYRDGLLPSFLGSLTVPAYTPVNMLKAADNPAWMQRIAAKTGSLNEPHSVFALAGYARLAGGQWAAFAVLINGTAKHEVPLWTAITATRDALTPILRPLHEAARP